MLAADRAPRSERPQLLQRRQQLVHVKWLGEAGYHAEARYSSKRSVDWVGTRST